MLLNHAAVSAVVAAVAAGDSVSWIYNVLFHDERTALRA